MSRTIKIIFVIIIFLGFIALHELTHYEIFKNHGCEDIHFKINKKGIHTIAFCPTDSQDLSNDINEIVGYNIMPFLMSILFILILKE